MYTFKFCHSAAKHPNKLPTTNGMSVGDHVGKAQDDERSDDHEPLFYYLQVVHSTTYLKFMYPS